MSLTDGVEGLSTVLPPEKHECKAGHALIEVKSSAAHSRLLRQEGMEARAR
jgi:hypothetical protein